MIRKTFFCIDGHTCGNPVRVVAGGGPLLDAPTIAEKRLQFMESYDWIRRGLMFEPRGHDIMSGSILYEPADPANDIAILFIETSGCLPMCGHGTIGTVTIAIEHQLMTPKTPGRLRLETPAGLVIAEYTESDGKVTSVSITNVASYLDQTGLTVDCPELGELTVDVGYGGNFYAIVDPQPNFPGLETISAADVIRWSPVLREQLNEKYVFQHPVHSDIRGLHHLQWTGTPIHAESTARNAVFYGDKAIDRSPCGTGTSARMAQWHAQGKLKMSEKFVHESIIGSQFTGEIIEETSVGGRPAIIPKITGWARVTGLNTITIDESDPYAFGFQVV